MLLIDLNEFVPNAISKNILSLSQPKTTIILLLLLLAISICYLLLFATYIKKPKLKHYEIINPPGFMRHKKTGAYYCQPCLIQRHIASELSTIAEKEFVCRICKESYKIDYSVLICDKYLSMVHDRAVEELIHKKENV